MEHLAFKIIGALGSLATAGAFIILFFKDKYKQDQIDRLTELSREAENQTQQMIEGNKLQNEIIGLFQKQLSSIENSIQLEKAKWKSEIKPKFIVNDNNKDGDLYGYKIILQNIGGIAKYITICKESDEDSGFYRINDSSETEIPRMGNYTVQIYYEQPDIRKPFIAIKFKINYEDESGNKYFQIFMRNKRNTNITNPEEY